MRVAFVTNYKSGDKYAWSGSMFNMLNALKKSGLDVRTIDNLRDPYSAIFRTKRLFKNMVLKKKYLRDREPLTLQAYARQVERRSGIIKPDVIFSAGSIPIAYVRTKMPIIFWADASFDGMVDFYPEFTNLCDETLRNGHRMEQAALANCRLAIYSSDWAAKSAIANYSVDRKKIKVVPYGANLAKYPSPNEVQKAIARRPSGVCRLLFVGVDWIRKGGDKALLVASELNRVGLVKAELHVVGCDPPQPLPSFVKTYGFLSKGNREHNRLLAQLYEASDFFILPSKAECAAVVVAEANAFGLPALVTNVGGMSTVVINEKNGRAFDPMFFVQDCVEYILTTISNKDLYHRLCVSASDEFNNRLNWETAAQAVLSLMTSEGLMG